MNLFYFFLPHPQTHKKAPLLSLQALVVYVGLFIFLQFGVRGISYVRPDILGISSSANVPELIRLTNQQRSENGLQPLKENSELDAAASAKAQNMFAESYWAHYSPSGKDPWGFILAAGYKFSYAGENLARNFSNSRDVVTAWMNSPTHRENIVNTHYTDVGMAVAYGKINGQDTILVVQEFGSPAVDFVAQNSAPVASNQPFASPVVLSVLQTPLPTPIMSPRTIALSEAGQSAVVNNESKVPLIDSFRFSQIANISLLTFLTVLLLLDLIVLRQRAVTRISARHWSHFALIAVAISSIAVSKGGQIL